MPGAGESQGMQTAANLRRLHEQIPQQSRAVIFDHDDDGALIDGQKGICIPVPGLAKSVDEPISAPHLLTMRVEKVPDREKAFSR